jgi:hypothetical protein
VRAVVVNDADRVLLVRFELLPDLVETLRDPEG